jgi:hypothetical protein
MFGKRIPLGFLLIALLASNLFAGQPDPVKEDEQILQEAQLGTNGPALLEFFEKHSLTDMELLKARALVKQLGANSFREREHATAKLIKLGSPVFELLREAAKSDDLEVSNRAFKCLKKIEEDSLPTRVPMAAARLLAHRNPDGTVRALLNYLPFSPQVSVTQEVQKKLSKLALRDGKIDPVLVAGLKDRSPVIRAAAAEVLTTAEAKDSMPAVRALLDDPVASVRLRVATALALKKDKSAIPVIIAALPELSQLEAWQAEDLLLRLATDKKPPALPVGKTKEDRQKAQAAWSAWWKENEAKVDLAKLHSTEETLGYTVVVLLDPGQVVELGPNNQVRWQVDHLGFPLDLQMLPGDRLLVSEYHAGRVTERNFKGEVLWQHVVQNPLMAQRLPNGNTFISSDSQFIEIDRQGKEVFKHSLPNDERIMKAAKLPNGDIVCMTDLTRVVRLDSKGNELKSFNIYLGKKLFGGRIHMLPSGNVLVPHNAEGKVVEYDINGKNVWQVHIDEPIAATRLANGNTLVTSMSPNNYRAVEYDQKGEVVWEYRSETRVTRAIRR